MSNNQRLWFSLHGWISLPVWFLFAFICLTGTICVVSHEITWLANPAARATNPDNLPAKPIAELVAAAQTALPNAKVTNVIRLEPYLVTAVSLTSRERPAAIAYVNPYTAEVQGIFDGVTFIGFMRSLHGWLLFPWHHRYSVGYYLVSALSLVMIIATISGMLVYKQFWRSYLTPKIRLGGGLRKACGDLHRVIGAWSIWFLLIIGTTGIWYLTQAVMWHNDIEIDSELSPLADNQIPRSAVSPTPISFSKALDAATKEFDQFTPAWISFPEHSRDYFQIAGKGERFLFDEYSYRVSVNPWSGEVTKSSSPSDMNFIQIISHIADPLHYGKFGGLTTKIIWFIFGSLVTAMSIFGFIIWLKRTASTRSNYRYRWLFYLNGAIIIAPIFYLYSSLNPQFPKDWGAANSTTLTITPSPADDSPPYREGDGYQKDFTFDLCQGCASQIRLAYAKIGHTPPTITDEIEGILHGHGDILHAHVPSPRKISKEDKLWVIVEKWDGSVERLEWEVLHYTAN